MMYSKTGVDLTKRFEGCQLKSYRDSVGVLTIAYGHTSGVTEGMICTQEQADVWLQQDTQWATDVVNHLVTFQLTQNEFDALCDFVYNVGSGNFASSTMLKLINAGNLEAAADEFCKWDHAGGIEVAGLLRRRQDEQREFTETS
jgi:lysozyme